MPGSRFSVEKIELRGRWGPLEIIKSWQGWESLSIDLGKPVYNSSLYKCWMR